MFVIERVRLLDSQGRLSDTPTFTSGMPIRSSRNKLVVTVLDTISGSREELWSTSDKRFWEKLQDMQPYGYSLTPGATDYSGAVVLVAISQEAVDFLGYVSMVKMRILRSGDAFFSGKHVNLDWVDKHKVLSYDKLGTLFMHCGFSNMKGAIYPLLDVCLHMQDCWFEDSLYLIRGREKAYNGFKYSCYRVDFEDVQKARLFLTKMAVLKG